MSRGRKPNPTKLQVDLRGDPSKRRKNTVEPQAPQGSPICPEHLQDDPIAFQEWNDICCQLEKMELLSTTDGRSLELYCLAYSKYRDAESKVKKHGDVLLLGANKHPMVSPYYTAMNRYSDDLRKWLIEFGLTPSARSRMRVTVDRKTKNKWDGILKVSG